MRVHQRGQGTVTVRHVGCVFDALVSASWPHRVTAGQRIAAQHGQRCVGQRTFAAGHCIGRVRATDLVRAVRPFPIGVQRLAQLRQHGHAGCVNALRIHHLDLLGHVGFARQREHQFFERGVQCGVAQHGAHRFNESMVKRDLRFSRTVVDGIQHAAQRQPLGRFPAHKGIGVVLQQHQQIVVTQTVGQADRR